MGQHSFGFVDDEIVLFFCDDRDLDLRSFFHD
jgi:hypothetical protein